MLSIEFKFEIGDIVAHKGSLELLKEAPEAYIGSKRAATAGGFVFLIVERHAVECPGGVQHYYMTRHAGPRGVGTEWLKFNEVELALFDDEARTKMFGSDA